VALKGLFLTGGNTGQTGIGITAAAAVHIDHVTVERFAGSGILMNSPAGTELYVADSVSRSNGEYGLSGCCGGSSLAIDNSRFEGNYVAIHAATGSGSVTRSIASHNGAGLLLDSEGGSLNATAMTATNNVDNGTGFYVSRGRLTLDSCVASGGQLGLFVNLDSTARITRSTFTNNQIGIRNSGTLETRGNSTLEGNAVDFEGSGPVVTLPPY
jgi:hypothetical protein